MEGRERVKKVGFALVCMDLSEAQTRKDKIDPLLKKVGWRTEYIKEEVNSVKSNFKTKEYTSYKKAIEKGVDKFIDYLLLDEDYSPLAIVEAKKTSVSIEKGEIQARSYQKDIEEQTGKKIAVFLTNGDSWYFLDQKERKRKILIPFNQKDLHRRQHLYENEKAPNNVKINAKIVDRGRNIEAVKQVLEHFSKGHRSALVNMATGTGKTRVAMAIIDALIKSSYVQNVLFVVDRISLANQAKEKGFKEFFNEPVCELNVEGFSDSARLYVSTVQTLTNSDNRQKRPMYEKFGSGSFDLIIFDEAHRSFYDRNNILFSYFDCLKLGLTATPSGEEFRDTFKLFDCEYKKPTVRYDYEIAVNDRILAPYVAEVIETRVLSLGIEGAKLTKELKQALKEQEEDPDKTELPGARFERYFTDSRTNELIINEFIDRCYKSDDGKPCKSIFFCASVKHAESLKKIFDYLYPNLAKEVRVITSDRTRYMDEVKRFEKDSEPRIALSVGVLDTGIDIPEICNLVFVKPVFSPIRFWQMLGRGTRNLEACKHKDWLPSKNGTAVKENFLILDFKFGDHSNVEFHKLDRTKNRSKVVDSKTRIFLEQVDLLEKKLDQKQRKVIEKEIIASVRAIDTESPAVIEKLPIIKRVVSEKFDLVEHIKELRRDIAPLLIYSKSDNSKVYTFVSDCVKLFRAIQDKNNDKKGEIREIIEEKVNNVWERGLEVIQAKSDDLKKVMQEKFWEELTFEDVDFLIREIAPLMIYYEVERKKMLRVDAPDVVLKVEEIKHEMKENEDLVEFVENNALIKKIRNGEGITAVEILEIERKLSELNSFWTIENIQNIMKIDFVSFIREMIGIKSLPDPEQMIKNEFDKYVLDRNEHYNSDQMKFLRLLKEVFVRTKHITLRDLAKHPLTEERPLDKFSKEQLEKIVEKCNKLKWR